MAFQDLTIGEQYALKTKYNEVRLAMEAATLTLNPATMQRVADAIAAIPVDAPPLAEGYALVYHDQPVTVFSSKGAWASGAQYQGLVYVESNAMFGFRLPSWQQLDQARYL